MRVLARTLDGGGVPGWNRQVWSVRNSVLLAKRGELGVSAHVLALALDGGVRMPDWPGRWG